MNAGLFPEKDKALPIPSQNPTESGFLIGAQKFADLVIDQANFEGAFVRPAPSCLCLTARLV